MGVALIASAPAAAQDAKQNRSGGAASPKQVAQASSDTRAIKELQRRLDERDEFILDLLERVQRLERQMAIGAPSVARPVNAALTAPTAAVAPTAPPPAPAVTLSPQLAQQQSQAQAAPPAPPQSAPGEFEVSEEDAQRALERALVQTGAALLPLGKFEFVPSVGYQFSEVSHPSQLALTDAGVVLITENATRSTQIDANALLRAGLPWDMQAEIGFPYDYKSISNVSRLLGSNLSETDRSGHGTGDLTLTLTKHILDEGQWRPGLFLSQTWDSDTGQTSNGIPMGSGFNELRTGLTAVKRQDPLVFTAGFTYQTTLEKRNVTPGDQYIPAVGMLFAVSPETSLRFAQQMAFVRPTKIGGNELQGSDQTQAFFTFGLLSILARGLVLDFSASVGETPDSPDFSFRVGFPIRLN